MGGRARGRRREWYSVLDINNMSDSLQTAVATNSLRCALLTSKCPTLANSCSFRLCMRVWHGQLRLRRFQMCRICATVGTSGPSFTKSLRVHIPFPVFNGFIWFHAPWQTLSGFHKRAVTTLSFSPDGRHLASIGCDDNHSIAVYDWKNILLRVRTSRRQGTDVDQVV